MIMNKETAIQAARFLLQIKAIKLNNENPFTWASGRKSPIYCDNRVTLSHPEIRTFIRQQFVAIVNELFADVDVIAGVATGGIPQGVLVAQDLGKPFVYVRPSEKAHGLQNKIEGDIKEGQTVVVIEDLISTAGSSIEVVNILRDAGCNVLGIASMLIRGFNLDIDFAGGSELTLSIGKNVSSELDTIKDIVKNVIKEEAPVEATEE